jgi:hypothetical protein
MNAGASTRSILVLAFASLAVLSSVRGDSPGAPIFLRGDSDGDGKIDLTDPLRILGSLFLGDLPPECPASSDSNDDGSIDLSDAVYTLNHLFLGGTAPPVPWPDCGRDPTPDALGCSGPVFPQLIPVDPETGVDPLGRRAVEVLVDKLALLREARRDEDGNVPPDSELALWPARLYPIGKVDGSRLLAFESESKTVLSIDLERNKVARVMTRDAFLELFDYQAQRPSIGRVIRLQSGWLLGYERTAKFLFAMRADPGGEGIIAVRVLTQNEMQNQVFPPDYTQKRVQVTIKHMIEFEPDEVLVVSENPEVDALHHLRIEDKGDHLEASFIQKITEPEQGWYDFLPFVSYTEIQRVTLEDKVDVKDFPPVKLPGLDRILIFERDSSSFLAVDYMLLPPEPLTPEPGAPAVSRFSTTIETAVSRDDLVAAVGGAKPFAGQFTFTSSFLHPDAGLDPRDPTWRPLVFAFDDETNNLFAYDFSKGPDEPGKIRIFTSAEQLVHPADFRFDPALDDGVFDPVLYFMQGAAAGNKLAFDAGPARLISIDLETGGTVVVLHKRDVTGVTEIGLVNLNWMALLDPPPAGAGTELRAIDFESCSVLGIRLEYLPVTRGCLR